MRETEKEIEKFVDNVIKKKDIVLLDILWIFYWCIARTPKSGYYEKKGSNVSIVFEKLFYRVCIRNLQKKFNLRQTEIKKKIKMLTNWLNSMPDFLSYETYNEDVGLLGKILHKKSSDLIIKNVKDRIQNLSE
ncbi:MAG: hypothetical protein DRN40_07365, partial [Thermoplasmata archaeon]